MAPKDKISVCVPAYNRPKMLSQLIISFLNQDYDNKELVISDDSSNNDVKSVCDSFADERIQYYKNENNLGNAKNFLMCIKRATGDFIIVLGDDDLLFSELALSRYVEVFNKYPDVYYVYSNSIQFSNQLTVEYIFSTFQNDVYYKKGEAAMEGIWATSAFIPGIGLRNNFDFSLYYPSRDILFPQVELVGNIINMHDSFGISDVLIAGRAHNEQLGFYAIKGERIKGTEKHGLVELFEIFRKLNKTYRLNIDETFLSKKLVRQYCTMILKEKMIVGNAKIKYNYKNFCEISDIAKKSKRLKFFYSLALVTPRSFIKFTKYIFTKAVYFQNKESFGRAKGQLDRILTSKQYGSIGGMK